MPRVANSGGRMVTSTAIRRDISVKPPKTPTVQYREVACIDCAAGVGEYCISGNGKRLATGHISRVRRAIRGQS